MGNSCFIKKEKNSKKREKEKSNSKQMGFHQTEKLQHNKGHDADSRDQAQNGGKY